jgi:hypothetical protein
VSCTFVEDFSACPQQFCPYESPDLKGLEAPLRYSKPNCRKYSLADSDSKLLSFPLCGVLYLYIIFIHIDVNEESRWPA